MLCGCGRMCSNARRREIVHRPSWLLCLSSQIDVALCLCHTPKTQLIRSTCIGNSIWFQESASMRQYCYIAPEQAHSTRREMPRHHTPFPHFHSPEVMPHASRSFLKATPLYCWSSSYRVNRIPPFQRLFSTSTMAAKLEWLCLVPDHPDMLAKRMEVRP